MEQYRIQIDGGQGGETTVWAEDVHEALEEGIAWAKGGDWTYPAAFRVSATNEDDESDTLSALVEMDGPDT